MLLHIKSICNSIQIIYVVSAVATHIGKLKLRRGKFGVAQEFATSRTLRYSLGKNEKLQKRIETKAHQVKYIEIIIIKLSELRI